VVIIFSVQLNWLPAVGAGPGGSSAWGWDWEHIRYLILPAITTSVIPMGIVTRTVRALTGDILSQDFVEALRAKGLREPTCSSTSSRTPRRPLAVMGLQLGYMLGGSILIETVFSWPGSGLLLNSRSSSATCRCCKVRFWCWRCSLWPSISWSISRKRRSIHASSGADTWL
jgi:peptide/nickel transport system permease protein